MPSVNCPKCQKSVFIDPDDLNRGLTLLDCKMCGYVFDLKQLPEKVQNEIYRAGSNSLYSSSKPSTFSKSSINDNGLRADASTDETSNPWLDLSESDNEEAKEKKFRQLQLKARGLKECPFCAEPIKEEALKCKHCGSLLENVQGLSSGIDLKAPLTGKGDRVVEDQSQAPVDSSVFPKFEEPNSILFDSKSKKDPTTAIIMSLFPGLGQLYNDEFTKGLGIFFGFLILIFFPFIIQRFLGLPTENTASAYQILSYLSWINASLIWLFAITDAYKRSKKAPYEIDPFAEL